MLPVDRATTTTDLYYRLDIEHARQVRRAVASLARRGLVELTLDAWPYFGTKVWLTGARERRYAILGNPVPKVLRPAYCCGVCEAEHDNLGRRHTA